MPDFAQIAAAYGITSMRLDRAGEVDDRIREVLETPGPVLCDVDILAERRVIPQVKFGRPIEDAEPLLPRDEFLANMIVPPLDVSKD